MFAGFLKAWKHGRKELTLEFWKHVSNIDGCDSFTPRDRSYSGLHFAECWLNTERYRVSLPIQSEWGKIRTRINSNMDTFYAVLIFFLVCLNFGFIGGAFCSKRALLCWCNSIDQIYEKQNLRKILKKYEILNSHFCCFYLKFIELNFIYNKETWQKLLKWRDDNVFLRAARFCHKPLLRFFKKYKI